MPFEFHLPDVFEGTAEAEIVEWKVEVGDEVKEDQPLVDVETDKAVVTIPCPTDGVVLKLSGEPGEVVPVGELLAVFGDRSELGEQRAAQPEPAPAAADDGDGRPTAAPPAAAASAAAAAVGRPLASPAVRRLARERAVALGSLSGSGPAGRIVREDVLT